MSEKKVHEEVAVEAPKEPAKKKTKAVKEPVADDTPKTMVGHVLNGCFLRVRKEALSEAEVVGTLDPKTEVVIDTKNSTDKFYKVTAKMVKNKEEFTYDGYCMKEYIVV